jgi:RimJ/RimL family protein N-acetyltransferase
MSEKSISFRLLSGDTTDAVLSEFWSRGNDTSELSDILSDLSSFSDDGAEVAVCLIEDALLVRIYDTDRYLFTDPIGLIDGYDIKHALRLIASYCVREMIPLCFTDVPRDELGVYSDVFPLIDARIYDDDEDMFYVFVRNECDRLGSWPLIDMGRVSLSRITANELGDYSRLCRDAEVNKYWGYDVRDDNILDTDTFFLDVCEREFNMGVAITLGIFSDGVFIGEGVLYSFDYFGGASVGVRLLPEYQGLGLGREALAALIELGRSIGLKYLCAEILLLNDKSCRMALACMKETNRDGEKLYLKIDL